MTPTWFRQSTNQGCRFLVFGRISDVLKGLDSQKQKRHWHGFVGGGIAGGINVYVNNFADVVKTRMQNQNNSVKSAKVYKSSLHCLQDIVRSEGILALWNGSTARVVRLVPGQAITFGAYSFFDSLIKRNFPASASRMK